MSHSVCRFFQQGRCKFGSDCRFSHAVGDTNGSQNAADIPKPATVTKPTATQRPIQQRPVPKKQKSQIELELEQLKRRAPQHYNCTKNTQQDAFTVQFGVRPSDPEFPFELEALRLEFQLPVNYPASGSAPSQFKVMNTEIPQELCKRVERFLELEAVKTVGEKSLTLLTLMNVLDRNLERLLTVRQGTSVDVNGVVSAQSQDGVKIKLYGRITAPTSTAIAKQESDSGSSDSSDSSSDEEETKDLSAELKDKLELKAEISAHGTAIKLEALHMRDIGVVECRTVGLVVECNRCRTQTEFPTVPAHATPSKQCAKCKTVMKLRYQPSCLHQHSPDGNQLGIVDTDNCTIIDMLASTFTPTCINCTPPSAGDVKQLDLSCKQAYPLITVQSHCVYCHHSMEFGYGHVRFSRLGKQTGLFTDNTQAAVPTTRKQKKAPREFTPGQPLADNGTCRHYGKSFRWLRFPCCGRAFPCDQCHAAANKDGHEMVYANRMICGFCSREQRIVSGQAPVCNHCGSNLTRTSGGTFWEGGKGTRDKQRMSRRDPHKYSGLNKTKSRKSEK